jgi:rubredoxin
MDSDSPFYYPLYGHGGEEDESLTTHCIEANLYAVKSDAGCPECGRSNVVITLGLTPNPYRLSCMEFKFFTFFGITQLPASLLKSLKKINPHYDLYSRQTKKDRLYLNACARCGYVFEDDDLRQEPGDAFLPLVLEDYERIELIDLRYQTDYQLKEDEDENRYFEQIEANIWNPTPDIWQVIVEQQDL